MVMGHLAVLIGGKKDILYTVSTKEYQRDEIYKVETTHLQMAVM